MLTQVGPEQIRIGEGQNAFTIRLRPCPQAPLLYQIEVHPGADILGPFTLEQCAELSTALQGLIHRAANNVPYLPI